MSLQPASRAPVFAPTASVGRVSAVLMPGVPATGFAAAGGAGAASASPDEEALEFVRFCYRRRRVGWPALYDEMSAVAARGAYRGYGYGDLAERGISFCLNDLPRLVALTERVIAEEQPIAEPTVASFALRVAPAT